MLAVELPAMNAAEAARVVRALGSHRYVAGKMHLVHAFALAAIGDPDAVALLANADLDIASRDERLWRRVTEADVASVLETFWTPGERAVAARARLEEWMARAELEIEAGDPFEADDEDAVHPWLVDAGWELLSLASLDPERHKGAINAFGDALSFDVARFEEESAIPAPVYLQELSAMGARELLRGVDDDGSLVAPLVLWIEGPEAYHDYVVRGVLRAAKLAEL